MKLKKWSESKDILIDLLEKNKSCTNKTQIYLLLGKVNIKKNEINKI